MKNYKWQEQKTILMLKLTMPHSVCRLAAQIIKLATCNLLLVNDLFPISICCTSVTARHDDRLIELKSTTRGSPQPFFHWIAIVKLSFRVCDCLSKLQSVSFLASCWFVFLLYLFDCLLHLKCESLLSHFSISTRAVGRRKLGHFHVENAKHFHVAARWEWILCAIFTYPLKPRRVLIGDAAEVFELSVGTAKSETEKKRKLFKSWNFANRKLKREMSDIFTSIRLFALLYDASIFDIFHFQHFPSILLISLYYSSCSSSHSRITFNPKFNFEISKSNFSSTKIFP